MTKIALLEMRRRMSETANTIGAKTVTRVVMALIGIVSLTTYGQSPSPSSASASDSVLPRNVVVALKVVNRFFPEVTQEATTGQNLSAVGKPIATRSVIYTNSNGSNKLTVSVDEYANASDASSAYEEAVQKSKIVPGFKPIFAPKLGHGEFLGTATQGKETHIGVGAVNGTLFVAATVVGYDPTTDITAKLISLTREQQQSAKAALNPHENR
jgi:hypothetical protein